MLLANEFDNEFFFGLNSDMNEISTNNIIKFPGGVTGLIYSLQELYILKGWPTKGFVAFSSELSIQNIVTVTLDMDVKK